MRRLALITGAAVFAAAVMASAALGQYYVPLRYDARRGRPLYVPGREPWRNYGAYDPPNYDPYSFSAVQSRNLFVTGNVRAGKSFRGTVPYAPTGSELADALPSMRLSTFRRDSVGIRDIGTGVELGAPLPYFPQTGEVTTPRTAGRRFAPTARLDRPDSYGLLAPLPDQRAVTPIPPTAWSPGRGFLPRDVEGEPEGVQYPASTWEAAREVFRRGLLELELRGLELPEKEPAESETEPAAELPYEPTFRFESEPMNLRGPGIDEADRVTPTGLAPAEGPEGGLAGEPAAAEPGEAEAGDREPGWVSLGGAGQPRLEGVVTRYGARVHAAHAAFREGNYDRAAELYRSASLLEPGHASAAFGQVHALLGRRYYHGAALALERLVARHPEWVERPPKLTSVFPKAETYERIVRDLTERTKGPRGNWQLRFLLGYVLYTTGRNDEARRHLKQAATQGPGPAKVSGVLLEAMGSAGSS